MKSFLRSLAETLWLDEPSNCVQSGPLQIMDRASRNELVKTVEGLKEQLQQYKAKLRGTVQAVCSCRNNDLFVNKYVRERERDDVCYCYLLCKLLD